MQFTEEEEERMRLARERIRAASAKIAEHDAKRERDQELARIELEARDMEAIQQARDEHPGEVLTVVHTDVGCVIVKRPHGAVYKRFRDRGKFTTEALEELVRKSLAHPNAAGLDRILQEAPAALDRMADAVVKLAGLQSKEDSEK